MGVSTHDVAGLAQVKGDPRPNTAGKALRATRTDLENNEAMIAKTANIDIKMKLRNQLNQ